MRLRAPRGGAGAQDWLVTYGDMMSLLLVLFTFLFAMRTVRPARHVSLHGGPDSLGLPVVVEVDFEPGSDELAPRAMVDLSRAAERIDWRGSAVVVIGSAAGPARSTEPPGAGRIGGSRPARIAGDPEDLAARRVARVADRLREESGRAATGCIIAGVRGAADFLPPRAPPGPSGATGAPSLPDRVEVCLLEAKVGRELE